MRELLRQVTALLNDRKKRKAWMKLVSVLAGIVVFISVYMLILPALTMEKHASCGIPEHQHSDECYELRLVCGLEENEDTSDDIVTDVISEDSFSDMDIVEDLEPVQGHVHTDACYEYVLVCGKEPHTHSAACYKKRASSDVKNSAMDVSASSEDIIPEENDFPENGSGDDLIEEDAVQEEDSADEVLSYEQGDTAVEEDDGASAPDQSSDAAFDNSSEDQSAVSQTSEIIMMEGDSDGQASEIDTEAGVVNGAGTDKPESTANTLSSDNDTIQDKDGNSLPEEETADGNAIQESEITAQTSDIKDPITNRFSLADYLTGETAVYYSRVQESVEEGGRESGGSYGEWNRVENETVLTPADRVRVYLAYQLPAGLLNYTNSQAGYLLPSGLSLDSSRMDEINHYMNGIAAGTEDEAKKASLLGAEAVEGKLRPDGLGSDSSDENISAIVNVENITDTDGNFSGQELVFRFIPYTIEKNRDLIDEEGILMSKGQDVSGYFMIDFTVNDIMSQNSEVVSAENEEPSVQDAEPLKEAAIVFAHQDPKSGQEEISTRLKVSERPEETDTQKLENNQDPEKKTENDNTDAPAENEDKGEGEEKAADKDTVAKAEEPGAEQTADSEESGKKSEGDPVNQTGEGSKEDPVKQSGEESEEDSERQTGEGAEEDPAKQSAEESEEDSGRQTGEGAEDVSGNQTGEESEEVSGKDSGEESASGNEENGQQQGAAENSDQGLDSADTKEAASDAGTGQEAEAVDEGTASVDADTASVDEGTAAEQEMPAQTFEESIRVKTGGQASGNSVSEFFRNIFGMFAGKGDNAGTGGAETTLSSEAELTVHVDAEEGTFPAGTTMTVKAVGGKDLNTVSDAISEAVDSETCGFQAVDITFRNAQGEEIEPLKPVRVTFSSDLISEAAQDEKIGDPVVVHVQDDGTVQTLSRTSAENEDSDNKDSDKEKKEEEAAAATENSLSFETGENNESSNISPEDPGVADGQNNVVNKGSQEGDQEGSQEDSEINEDAGSSESADSSTGALSIEVDQFSIYVIVYTVDFKYSVDGKTYEYSLPGGGYINLRDLVDTLGVAKAADFRDADSFVTQVKDVKFSDESLLWVGRAEENMTVGQLRQSAGIESLYAAQLTKEEMEAFNTQTVPAGSWALISLLPFDSEEKLTVTMKNGDVWTVDVTDAQLKKTMITASGETYEITVTFGDDAEIPEGSSLDVVQLEEDDADYAGYIAQTAKAVERSLDALSYIKLLDIRILDPKGKEIEPKSPVDVQIRVLDRKEAEDPVQIIHFGKETEVLENTLVGDSVCFRTDGFSVYAVVTLDNLSELSGKAFSVINTQGEQNPKGTALMAAASDSNNTALQAKSTTVRLDPVGRSEKVYIANNSDISVWNFESIDDQGRYLITAAVNNSLKCLRIGADGVSLVDPLNMDADCRILVTEGTGKYKGKYKFSTEHGSLKLDNTKFSRGGPKDSNDQIWMSFADRSNLNEDDFVVYTAEKASVSGTVDENGEIVTDVNNDDSVIIYTRIWNEDSSRYDYYAIDYDGKLVKAYESGDTISWVGSKVNTMLWKFTEYYYEGTNTPNYYYELQNEYSGKYLAPQVSGTVFLSDKTIGLNLNGRRYNDYYSTILAWDAPYYDYASLKVSKTDNWQLVSAPMSKADDFYFAKMVPAADNSKLTQVSTVDNNQFGIKVEMQDYPYQGYYIGGGYRSETQTKILGRNSERTSTNSNAAYSGLLSRNLQNDGFPLTTQKAKEAGAEKAGVSLSQLYNSTIGVNHQFLTSTYKETGYFEYNCTQNFAHLITNTNDSWYGKDNPDGGKYGVGDFVVYNQIGTSDLAEKDTLKHGQFLPFNDLNPKYNGNGTSKKNPKNETDLYGYALSSLDPRKGEKLYGIGANWPGNTGTNTGDVDYFFGMKLSAQFMQSENGLDAWGHDLVFEFSGDDDFWLYVDGMLVLDLGGVHSAIDGSVNFRTGKVYYYDDKGKLSETTLRELYKKAFLENHPDLTGDEASVQEFLDGYFKDGGTVFKDFSGHTMNMFYMERGAAASNLHMRFNLTSYTEGEVLLEKEVSGSGKVNTTFPFQVWYETKTPDGLKYVLWNKEDTVTDIKTGDTLTCGEYEAGGLKYDSVYLLKPGQTVSIRLPEEDTKYFIRECALDSNTFDQVKVNGAVIDGSAADVSVDTEYGVSSGGTGTAASPNRLKDYVIADSTVAGRKKVIYDNHVDKNVVKSLTITKRLWEDEEKTRPVYSGNGADADNTEFKFRIYIGKEGDDNYSVYNTGKYYVKDPEGYYCKFENGGFVSTGKTDILDLDTTVPEGNWKSEREMATFYTSPGGAVDRIKEGYSIEIPDLLAGTAFLVEERDGEIPAGYTRLGYSVTEGAYTHDNTGMSKNEDVIDPALEHQTVTVHNRHGYGLIAEKVWSDADFMESHDSAYFAVYLRKGNERELVSGTVRELKDPETSVRWFFPQLEDGKTLNDYEVYEVALTGDGISADPATGKVTGYDSIERKEAGSVIRIGGKSSEHGYSADINYTVDYLREILSDAQIEEKVHSRKDKVLNSRPGIKLLKTDMNGEPLAGAKFELSEIGGTTKTFTTDESGLIAVAYLKPDKEYTLKEVAAPYGYLSLIDELKIKVKYTDNAADGEKDVTVYVNDSETDPVNGYYSINQVSRPTVNDMPTITVKNRDNVLTAVKVDSSTGLPMQGIEFSLYREVTESGTGKPMPDYKPMEGYESLITNSDGIIPRIVLRNSENPDGLTAGNYYLHEVAAPSAYKPAGVDIRICIAATGQITLESAKRPNQTGSWTIENLPADVAGISLTENGQVTITVRNTPKDPVRIKKMETGSSKTLQGVEFELYRQNQIENARPVEGADPCLTGVTDENGILNLGGLENGTYYLFETKTLDGYLLLDSPVVISSITEKGKIKILASLNAESLKCSPKKVDGKDVWEISVYNSTGYELPETGGTGSGMFILLGSILTLGAGILLLARIKILKK